MTKLILSLGALAAANLLLAFLIHCYIFFKIGPGIETDAFYVAMTLPQLILSVLTGTLFYIVVPLLTGEDEKHLSRGAWSLFLLIGGFLGPLALVLYLLVPFWIPLLVPGFSFNSLVLTAELARIQLIGMVFSALSSASRAAYHARQNFIWPELSQFMESVVGLCALTWAVPRFGIHAVAGVNVVRAILLTLLLLPGLGNYSKPEWRSDVMRKTWHRTRPLTLATLYYKSGPLVDRFLTSMVSAGGLSLLYFSQQIYESASQLINRAIIRPLLPQLAVQAKSGQWRIFKRTYQRRLLVVTVLAGAAGLVFICIGEPLLRLRGQISEENIRSFWWITVGLTGFFIGGVMGQILSTAFYAKGDVETPIKVGVIGFTLGIGLKVLGFVAAGLPGIAFGTTLYYLGNAFAMYLLLERKEDALSR